MLMMPRLRMGQVTLTMSLKCQDVLQATACESDDGVLLGRIEAAVTASELGLPQVCGCPTHSSLHPPPVHYYYYYYCPLLLLMSVLHVHDVVVFHVVLTWWWWWWWWSWWCCAMIPFQFTDWRHFRPLCDYGLSQFSKVSIFKRKVCQSAATTNTTQCKFELTCCGLRCVQADL